MDFPLLLGNIQGCRGLQAAYVGPVAQLRLGVRGNEITLPCLPHPILLLFWGSLGFDVIEHHRKVKKNSVVFEVVFHLHFLLHMSKHKTWVVSNDIERFGHPLNLFLEPFFVRQLVVVVLVEQRRGK